MRGDFRITIDIPGHLAEKLRPADGQTPDAWIQNWLEYQLGTGATLHPSGCGLEDREVGEFIPPGGVQMDYWGK